MGAGHDAHLLHRAGDSPVHRLAPEVKIVATVGFTVATVATPREAFWAFGGYAVLLALVAAVARIPPGWLAARSVIAVPFVAFAFVLPFLGAGERLDPAWLPVTISVEGTLGAWNIVAKTLLGLLASLLLVGTTAQRDLILGLDRLRCPSALTQIATFMLRYVDVLVAEAKRMRVARLARGDDPRFLWQARGFAASLGALFLRAYGRGERVWLAMRARGWTGRMPDAWHEAGRATVRQWTVGACVPLTAATLAVTAALTG